MISKESNIIRIAITDDHRIVIDGLKLVLKTRKNLFVAAEATSATEMMKLLKTTPVDILLTDIMMPQMNGFELSILARREFPGIKILALSMSEDGEMIVKMIEEAKVDGYIPKASGKNELIDAIESIISGTPYFSAQILEQYEVYKKLKNDNEVFHLTTRELEIIECIMQYFSNKQIADRLFISERTVETHRKNIYRKTNTKGEAALILFVKKHKLFS
ncbi:MAG: response regulator transcription factor [Panacibacter sp.]